MSDIRDRISAQINEAGRSHVWVPSDFATFGSRDAIDKTCSAWSRAAACGIDRGVSDRPTINSLTKRRHGLPRGGGCALPARSDPSAGRWHDGLNDLA